MRLPRASLALAIAAALASTSDAGTPRVTIHGNGAVLGSTPLVVPVDPAIEPGDYHLVPDPEGPALAANVFDLDGRRQLALMLDHLGPDQIRTFQLQAAGTDNPRLIAGALPIGVEPAGEEVRILAGGEPFATLRQGERKPYLWPVVGPTGEPVTRAFPMMDEIEGEDHDHPHQRSFWFTHGDVNGWDFWASDPRNGDNPKFGTIKQTSLDLARGGLAVGVLETSDDWVGGDGKTVCQDRRVIEFSAAEGVRFLDVDVQIRASEGRVTFGDTKEGTFGVRLASTMNANRKPGGAILNAEGLTGTDAWGKPSPWVDYTGPVDGRTLGVAIFDHPENLRHPTTWHVRDYGLFAANPFGYHDFGIKSAGEHILGQGERLRFRYRVVLHEGAWPRYAIASAFRAFAAPPKVEVVVDPQ